MPLRTKTTQTDSDAMLKMIFGQSLVSDFYRQVKRTQRQM